MDLSKNYTSMCNKAKEIQDKWDVKDGDYFQYFDEGGKSFTDITVGNFGMEYREVANINSEFPEGFWRFNGGYEWEDELVCLKKDAVWLPKQDQLQEMALKKRSLCCVISDFYWFVGVLYRINDEYLSDITDETIVRVEELNKSSMEKLWLQFIMKEIYSKKWNGKDWTKL